MKEKIKKILFLESKWLFIIFLVIALFSCIFFYNFLGKQVLIDGINKILSWQGWTAISNITLILTVIVIAYQAYFAKKQIEYSVMPNSFFFLRTEQRVLLEKKFKDIHEDQRAQLVEEKINQIPLNNKLRTLFVVKNNSKYPILFKVKINYEVDGKIINSSDTYWKSPLNVYPKGMIYPNVINIQNIKINKNKKIIAHIYYTYTPRFASKMNYGTFYEKWSFNLKEFRWRGPQNVKEENII